MRSPYRRRRAERRGQCPPDRSSSPLPTRTAGRTPRCAPRRRAQSRSSTRYRSSTSSCRTSPRLAPCTISRRSRHWSCRLDRSPRARRSAQRRSGSFESCRCTRVLDNPRRCRSGAYRARVRALRAPQALLLALRRILRDAAPLQPVPVQFLVSPGKQVRGFGSSQPQPVVSARRPTHATARHASHTLRPVIAMRAGVFERSPALASSSAPMDAAPPEEVVIFIRAPGKMGAARTVVDAA